MNRKFCVCTAIAGNFVSLARVLTASFRQYHPDIPFYVLIADTATHSIEHATTLRLQDLQIPGLNRMLIRYDRKQIVVAAKPALLRHLLDSGFQSVLYLDADMLVTASLDGPMEKVASHSLTLTPHLGPNTAGPDRTVLEQALLFAGMYNGGFVGASNSPETRRFLAWWEERLRTHCLEDVRAGFHYDQRWLDMAPAFVADLHLLRDPGVNLAYWNLPDFDSTAPIRLFHFSGFNPAIPNQVTRHQPSLRVDQLGPVAHLFSRYVNLLNEAAWPQTIHRPWPWDGWRSLFRRLIRYRLTASSTSLPAR